MSFTIKSNESDLTVNFSDRVGDSFLVQLSSSNLTVTRGVSVYMDPSGIANFLEWISQQEKPWVEEVGWESLEGEFKIFAACSSLGAVTFRFMISNVYGGEDWEVETLLQSDLGQIPEMARAAKVFFNN